MKFLAGYSSQILGLTRIVAGLCFLEHGTSKLLNFPAGRRCIPRSPLLAGAAGIIELVAGTLITLGLFSRCAAFIASGEMAVAYFLVHMSRRQPLPHPEWRRCRHPVLLHLPLSGRGRSRLLRRQREVSQYLRHEIARDGPATARYSVAHARHPAPDAGDLLRAYAEGLFPMAERRGDPTLYWVSPEKRGIIPLDGFHVPHRLARTVRSGRFHRHHRHRPSAT